jgi:hypothetical protein
MTSRETLRSAAGLFSAAVGLVHLLVPGRLLAIAAWGYDTVLAVDFEPRGNATRRVRAVGLAFVAVAALCLRLRSTD